MFFHWYTSILLESKFFSQQQIDQTTLTGGAIYPVLNWGDPVKPGQVKIPAKFIFQSGLDIESQFSTINIGIEHGLSAILEFDLEFGNLKAHGDGINFNKVIKENNRSEYRGYLGNENATTSIKVSTRHGNIRLNVDWLLSI